MQAWVGGGKLWVRVTVLNTSSEPITVTRDAVVCVLPDGHRVGRATGTTTVHTPYFIPAGGTHAVYVEFAEEGFDWAQIPTVSVDFSAAITQSGQRVAVAPMMIAKN